MTDRCRKMVFGRYDYAAFFSFFAYAAGSVVLPVALVLLARELGFPLEAGGLAAGGALHLGRTIPMVVSMLLCGFAAGRWGKRITLGWSVVLMGLGVGLCATAGGYAMLFFAMMLAGFGEGVVEGLATPFVRDLHPDESGRYINFTHGFWSVGVLVTVIVSGVLLSAGVSWRLVVGAVGGVGFVAAMMILWPEGKGSRFPEHPEKIHWSEVCGHAMAIFRVRRFWLFFCAMFFAGGGEFCLTFWCASYIQLHFSAAAWAGGVGTAFFAGGMVVGRTGWGYFIRQERLKELVVYSAIAGAAMTAVLPLLNNLWVFFVLLFVVGIASAPFWPSMQSYCVDRMPKHDTTMILILLSCAGVPGCGVFTWLMGYIGNQAGGLGGAFYIVPVCYLTIAGLVGYDWYAHEKIKGKEQRQEIPAGSV